MKNIIIGVSALIIISILFVAVRTSIILLDENTKTDTFKEDYMEGCSDGTNLDYCECTYDYLLEDLGKSGFLKVAYKYTETEVLPDVMFDAMAKCLK